MVCQVATDKGVRLAARQKIIASYRKGGVEDGNRIHPET
jgi:hypothetical protein